MPILKGSNQERFPTEVLEPVASNCLLPQDCPCAEEEASVLFNWLSLEPGTVPSPEPAHSGFLIVSIDIVRGQTTVHCQVQRSPTGL